MSEALYEHLSDYWQRYKQKEELAEFWDSLALAYDNEYVQQAQAVLSKSVFDVPVFMRKQWVNLELGNYIDNQVDHEHYFMEFTAVGGETDFLLAPANEPEDPTSIGLWINGDKQVRGTDYTYEVSDPLNVKLTSPLSASDSVYVTWYVFADAVPHVHKYFEETLTAPKSSWTNASGDAFDPAGAGAYQPNDTEFPIEVYINGDKVDRADYTETSSIQLDLTVAASPGDVVRFHWKRESEEEVEQHKHMLYSHILTEPAQGIIFTLKSVSGKILGIDITRDIEHVFIDGDLATRNVDYTVAGDENDVLTFSSTLPIGTKIEVYFFYNEYLYSHSVDSDIVSSQYMQDGITKPTVVLESTADFTFETGFLLTNTQIADAWFPDLFVDEDTIFKNFGRLIDFERDSSEQYKQQVQGLYSVYWNGPSLRNIENGLKIILGLPFAITPTEVVSVTDDGADEPTYTIVLADGNNYTFSYPISPIVTPGQSLARFAALSDGVEVLDHVNSPNWYLKYPGFIQAISKFHVEDGWTYSGYFDDCGFFDDGGIFDIEFGENTEELKLINSRFYDVLKHHTFLVLVNSSLITSQAILDDLNLFINNIKPAWTDFILVASTPTIKDQQPVPSDSVTINLFP